MMDKKIRPLSWQTDIQNKLRTENIGNNFILFEDFSSLPMFMHPFKLDMLIVMVCIQGSGRGTIDTQPYNLTAPFVIIIRPNQILNYEYISADFTGYCLMVSSHLSSEFLINIDSRLSVAAAICEKPFAQLNSEDMKFVSRYFTILKKFMGMTDNPYRLEMVKHLTMMFFYLARPYFQSFAETTKQTRQSVLIDNFTQLVRENYRHERETAFYARKLNLTPKYLSQLIKSATGKSASDWIDYFVILEAKALLKSTNMSILQISEKLNFPSQSFFGKYFKRIEGVSPKRYRENFS